MCSGSSDGSIRVWGGAATELERTLRDEEDETPVFSFTAWQGKNLTNGNDSGLIRVWNVATGACDRKLEGHRVAVLCQAVSGRVW